MDSSDLLGFNPATVTGGSTTIGTVLISPNAPATGAVVTLSSNSSFVSVPASITVPGGSDIASFTVTTTRVQAGAVTATMSAKLNTTATAVLTVTPAPVCVLTTCAAQNKTCGTAPDGCGATLTCGSTCGPSTATVTLVNTGKGGKVTSSPAGLSGSGSAKFTIGIPVTLATDNGHGAVWTGLCNSNGVATRTCAFTVNSSGTVTANEQ